MKTISILGSTGSIGQQTIDNINHFKNELKVFGLAAGTNKKELLSQIKQLNPKVVSINENVLDNQLVEKIQKISPKCSILTNTEGLTEIASAKENDLLVVASSGTAAVGPTMAAIENKIPIALANKEVLVSAGDWIMKRAKELEVAIIPIDSEHAAIKQCIDGHQVSSIHKIILTASGGPFWGLSEQEQQRVTKADALQHPKWEMGQKITIDSATMMNKGLEVIEAHHLFGISFQKIQVVVHPQSVLHGGVEFSDGNIIGHLGPTDMRVPIQYALFYPEKKHSPWKRINLWDQQNLTFLEPDFNRFPLLKLAYEVGEKGGGLPAIMNAANEAAVHLFLDDKITFTRIYPIVEEMVSQFQHQAPTQLNDIIELDKAVKEKVFRTNG